MAKRINMAFEQQEYSALLEMAVENFCNPPDELRHILRLEIDRRNEKSNHKNYKEEVNNDSQ